MTDKEKIERALDIIKTEKDRLSKTLVDVKCNIGNQKRKISDLLNDDEYLIGNTIVQEARELEYLLKLQARLSIKWQENDVLEGVLKGTSDGSEEK